MISMYFGLHRLLYFSYLGSSALNQFKKVELISREREVLKTKFPIFDHVIGSISSNPTIFSDLGLKMKKLAL